MISCPINKAWLIIGGIVGGSTYSIASRLLRTTCLPCLPVALICGLFYCFSFLTVCGLCSCGLLAFCKRGRKSKQSQGETYQQLSDPSSAPILVSNHSGARETQLTPQLQPTYNPPSMSVPSSNFINPPVPPGPEKRYDSPNYSTSDLGHHTYDDYAPPQLNYDYHSMEDLHGSKTSFPQAESTHSYQPPSYPPNMP